MNQVTIAATQMICGNDRKGNIDNAKKLGI